MGGGEWVELEGVRPAPNETARELSFAAFANIYFLIVGGLVLLILTLARRAKPTPQVNFDRGEIRMGARKLPFSELDEARVDGFSLASKTLTLIFGKRGGLEFSVRLRDNATVVVPERTRELLARVIDSSAVVIPFDKYDPKGKFARSGFPMNVTLEEAVSLVRNPPLHGESLPITL